MTSDIRFVTSPLDRVMGCRGELSVVAPAEQATELVAFGGRLLNRLERCWSRFLPDSDISRINRADGAAVEVDPWTIVLLREMAIGIRLTGGTFDPTLLGAIAGLGYGPAWSRGHQGSPADRASCASWVEHTEINQASSTVVIPAGVRLDAGAIGKGLAGDIVAPALLDAGARAVRIVLGGDVRVTSPTVLGVASPGHDGGIVDRIVIASGGVATSGIARSWIGPGGCRVHHALDPANERPLERTSIDAVVQVTAAAQSAAIAEVLATAVLVDPSGRRIDALDRLGVGVLTVTAAGDIVANSSWESLRCNGRRTVAVAS